MRLMTPTQTAHRYVELFNENRTGDMGRLFAEDGLWEPPNGTPPTRGRAAIIAGYEALTEQVADMSFTEVRVYEIGNMAIAEMVTMSPAGPVGRIVDVFEVNDAGEILRMTGYNGPPPM